MGFQISKLHRKAGTFNNGPDTSLSFPPRLDTTKWYSFPLSRWIKYSDNKFLHVNELQNSGMGLCKSCLGEFSFFFFSADSFASRMVRAPQLWWWLGRQELVLVEEGCDSKGMIPIGLISSVKFSINFSTSLPATALGAAQQNTVESCLTSSLSPHCPICAWASDHAPTGRQWRPGTSHPPDWKGHRHSLNSCSVLLCLYQPYGLFPLFPLHALIMGQKV